MQQEFLDGVSGLSGFSARSAAVVEHAHFLLKELLQVASRHQMP
jgi:hypothetical protein